MNRSAVRSRSTATRRGAAALMAVTLPFLVAACSDDDATPEATATTVATTTTAASATTTTVPPDGSFPLLGPEEFQEMLTADPEIALIDVRTPEEFAEGHIAGAVNIDFESADFEAEVSELDRAGRYAVYCRTGNRSAQAMELMRAIGFRDVTNLDGGIEDWTAAGLPVE